MKLLLAALLIVPSLALADTRADFDPAARFEGRTTFTWKSGDWQQKMRDEDAFLDKYLRAAITSELEGKGIRFVESGPADLAVSYRSSLKERTDVLDDPLCFPRRAWCRDLDVRTYDEINIAVDISDAATSEPMWRGVASEPQAGEGRTQRQVERMMKRLFRKYPPKR